MNHMFFDLEGVLIDSWFNPEIFADLKPIIDQLDCIDLFTFAIYNQEDMDLFNTSIRPKIESFFGKKVNIVQSREELIPILNKNGHEGRHIDNPELSDFYTKAEAFRAYIQNQYNSGEFLLIDDQVPDSLLEIDGKDVLKIGTASITTIRDAIKRSQSNQN